MALLTTCLVLISCSVLISCENMTQSNTIDNTTGLSTEVTTDSIVEEKKNATINDEIVSGLRDVFGVFGIEVSPATETGVAVTARMKMSIFPHPLMFVPGLLVWGFAPVMLAKLKFFVMQTLMLNNMALMSAFYMTMRNIVFGPRPGPIVKYTNHGYGPNQFHHYHSHR